MSSLRNIFAAALALTVVLLGLTWTGEASAQTRRPEKIVFTVLSAEGQA